MDLQLKPDYILIWHNYTSNQDGLSFLIVQKRKGDMLEGRRIDDLGDGGFKGRFGSRIVDFLTEYGLDKRFEAAEGQWHYKGRMKEGAYRGTYEGVVGNAGQHSATGCGTFIMEAFKDSALWLAMFNHRRENPKNPILWIA